ncbi:hypothetical protein CI102_2717 [Trichoderma harzianum]|uniref:Uncharacterized protein n=1 Tax=Trichoderma harzianum CBS 226.95 TaxID=983964 RepID=A0A2T3ZU07_TRIHA|nr:hypothetical protein M431DRAFT_547187 [Trichoderma harzianum CBS 226.95]PKK53004.1 hypothetical protein CI102_2717 [Trichoderma harzianum]PTB48279.1 hypothetical protein M431DRAFT_547187 [Trichoderma harzianum CBS 226.95]
MATGTLSAPLERLPFHLLEGICSWLNSSKDGGLLAFSLANRQCASAAMRFRLRRIHLKIDRLSPDESFTFIDETPDMNIRLSFVRNLRISGSRAYEEDSEQNEIGREEIEEESFFAKPSPLCPSRLRSPLYESNELPQVPEEVLRMKIKYQETWVGIAKFISRLSCLSDLVYDCISQVPMRLLSALRDNCPDARLHVYTFSLRSLYQPSNEYHDVSPEEYALATSPNLYGIYMKYSSYDGDRYIGYNEEAVMQMVKGLAPRLSYVGMAGQPVGDTIELAHAIRLHRQSGKPKWKGFFINEGQLTKLHLGITTIDAVQALAIIGEDGGLSSLSSLSLMPEAWNLEQAMAADASVCRLLRAIKPLQSLELKGEIGDTAWCAVIDQHGNSLRELRFVPASEYYDDIEGLVLSCDRISLLSNICLNLEKPELRIPRTHGDGDEVGIYQTLGRLPRLKRISLVLDCSVINPPEVRHGESFIDMGGWELPVDAFRAALINNAMDSALAQSIFETIATMREYTGGSSMIDLKLKIYGAGNFGRFSIDSEQRIPLEWVGQSWFVRRNSRDGGPVVQKIKSFVDDLDVLKDDSFERDDLRAVWMDIWPGSPGDRRNQWHSFPLARSAD